MPNGGYKSDVLKIKKVLHGSNLKTDTGILIDWVYFIKLIKNQRDQQIGKLIDTSDRWAMDILSKYGRSSYDQTSYNCIFYYILKPFIDEMNSWGTINDSLRHPAVAQFIWNRINDIEKTPKKMDVFLAWLWRDHEEVAEKFYQDIGLEPRSYKSLSNGAHATAIRELTEQERKELIDQIEKIGQYGLVRVELQFPHFPSWGMIVGTFDCAEKGIYITCDGLNYDFRISLLDIVVQFMVRGFLLQPKIDHGKSDDEIEITQHCEKSSPHIWLVTVKNKDRNKPLCGRLLCHSTNGVLFGWSMIEGADFQEIIATHILERNHINIESVTKKFHVTRNPEKEEIICRIMEQEIIRICGGQTESYPPRTYVARMRYFNDPRDQVREAVDNISAIHKSKSTDFMELFVLSRLPFDILSNRILTDLNLSHADLRLLDLTGTKLVNCNIEGTIFPDSFYQQAKEGYLQERTEAGEIDLDYDKTMKETILMAACQNGDEATVKQLIESGVEINTKTVDGWTALMAACDKGHESVVRLLIERNVEINAKTRSGQTALMVACNKGLESVVRLLIERNVEINAKTRSGRTALMIACDKGLKSLARILIKNGAEVSTQEVSTVSQNTKGTLAEDD